MASSDYEAWRERLAGANDPAFWPITAIDELLAGGNAQFWCDGKAALVTRLVAYPGGARVLEAIAGAGDLKALTETLERNTEQWARAQGCTHLKADGRDGWRRALKGWRHYQTSMVKELADGQ